MRTVASLRCYRPPSGNSSSARPGLLQLRAERWPAILVTPLREATLFVTAFSERCLPRPAAHAGPDFSACVSRPANPRRRSRRRRLNQTHCSVFFPIATQASGVGICAHFRTLLGATPGRSGGNGATRTRLM